MKFRIIASLLLLLFVKIQSQDINNDLKLLTPTYISENIDTLSKKEYIEKAISRIIDIGQTDLLEHYLKLLISKNISYNKELESAVSKKIQSLNNLFTKLQYIDENAIQTVQPAFEWDESGIEISLYIYYSRYLHSAGCFEVDNERLDLGSDKQNIIYQSKCIISNYQVNFKLNIDLFSKVKRISSESHRGYSKFTFHKIENEDWGRLLKPGHYMPENTRKYVRNYH